jgi:hypothetical protein
MSRVFNPYTDKTNHEAFKQAVSEARNAHQTWRLLPFIGAGFSAWSTTNDDNATPRPQKVRASAH